MASAFMLAVGFAVDFLSAIIEVGQRSSDCGTQDDSPVLLHGTKQFDLAKQLNQ